MDQHRGRVPLNHGRGFLCHDRDRDRRQRWVDVVAAGSVGLLQPTKPNIATKASEIPKRFIVQFLKLKLIYQRPPIAWRLDR